MALHNFKCNNLMPLHFKGLRFCIIVHRGRETGAHWSSILTGGLPDQDAFKSAYRSVSFIRPDVATCMHGLYANLQLDNDDCACAKPS